ncbi:MAG: SoxR reducing system RseC family protein [Alistipes sp.]|nr:SoxR reducing system RseC family protein [Alistipes sp.]
MGNIQHDAVVERIEGDKVIVRVEKRGACAGCHAKGICGESGSERIIEVRTPYASEFKTGDKVVVALLKPSMGMTSVVWGYLLPLIVLVATLFGCKSLGVEDGPSALASIVAVALYYVGIYFTRKIFERKIEFTIFKEF